MSKQEKPKNLGLIVAMTKKGVIGKDGELPWHSSADMAWFRMRTRGNPCIMGRKTFDSIVKGIGKPLPGRTSFVLTRDPVAQKSYDNVIYGDDLELLIDLAYDYVQPDKVDCLLPLPGQEVEVVCLPAMPYLIGGNSVYDGGINRVTHAAITDFHKDYDGDTKLSQDVISRLKCFTRSYQKKIGDELTLSVCTRDGE